jgi:hypothetical protein
MEAKFKKSGEGDDDDDDDDDDALVWLLWDSERAPLAWYSVILLTIWKGAVLTRHLLKSIICASS